VCVRVCVSTADIAMSYHTQVLDALCQTSAQQLSKVNQQKTRTSLVIRGGYNRLQQAVGE